MPFLLRALGLGVWRGQTLWVGTENPQGFALQHNFGGVGNEVSGPKGESPRCKMECEDTDPRPLKIRSIGWQRCLESCFLELVHATCKEAPNPELLNLQSLFEEPAITLQPQALKPCTPDPAESTSHGFTLLEFGIRNVLCLLGALNL